MPPLDENPAHTNKLSIRHPRTWDREILRDAVRRCQQSACTGVHDTKVMLMMKARERQRLGLDSLTKIIPLGPAVERTRAQIAEYRRLRSLVKELVEVSEQICQAQMDASSARTGPKKGSKKRWRRRSGKKSGP